MISHSVQFLPSMSAGKRFKHLFSVFCTVLSIKSCQTFMSVTVTKPSCAGFIWLVSGQNDSVSADSNHIGIIYTHLHSTEKDAEGFPSMSNTVNPPRWHTLDWSDPRCLFVLSASQKSRHLFIIIRHKASCKCVWLLCFPFVSKSSSLLCAFLSSIHLPEPGSNGGLVFTVPSKLIVISGRHTCLCVWNELWVWMWLVWFVVLSTIFPFLLQKLIHRGRMQCSTVTVQLRHSKLFLIQYCATW